MTSLCPACKHTHPNGWACPEALLKMTAERDEALTRQHNAEVLLHGARGALKRSEKALAGRYDPNADHDVAWRERNRVRKSALVFVTGALAAINKYFGD